MQPNETPLTTETPLTSEQKVDFILAHSPMVRARPESVNYHKMRLSMMHPDELEQTYLNVKGDVLMGNIAPAHEDQFEPRINTQFVNPSHDA